MGASGLNVTLPPLLSCSQVHCASGWEDRAIPRPEPPADVQRPLHRDPGQHEEGEPGLKPGPVARGSPEPPATPGGSHVHGPASQFPDWSGLHPSTKARLQALVVQRRVSSIGKAPASPSACFLTNVTLGRDFLPPSSSPRGLPKVGPANGHGQENSRSCFLPSPSLQSYIEEVHLYFAFDPPLFFASQVFPPDEIEQVANKDDMKTSLKKVVKEVGTWNWRGEPDYLSLPSWAGH